MDFEYDIFISYAKPQGSGDDSTTDWTLMFCDYLSQVVKRLYDRKPTILLHDDLNTRKSLLEESSQLVFSKTAVFVVILSPEYLESKEYVDEMEEIHKAVMASNAAAGISHHRILKVYTLPIPLQNQPKFLQSELSYDFFEINRYNKKATTHRLNGNEPDQKFWSKLVDLAYDISSVLNDLVSVRIDVPFPADKKPGIFLAETTFDQVENRDMLKRELQDLGFNVLPLMPIPDDAEKARIVIDCHLRDSIMAVHLMGGYYGDFVKNSKNSQIDFQIKSVKEYIKSNKIKDKIEQLIWIPGDLRPADQRQALYLKRIQRDESQGNTEIIETSFEVFKTILNGKLSELTNPTPLTIADKNKLYAIFENNVKEDIQDYLYMIRDKGYELLELDSDNQPFYSLSGHIDNLLKADAVLIYKGSSTMEWLNSKIRDLVKTPGYGKSKPFRAVEIISSQKTADKSLLFLKNVPVNWDEEISKDVINHFLDQLVKK